MKKTEQQKKKMMILFCIFGLLFSLGMILMSIDIDMAAIMPGREELEELQRKADSLQKEADSFSATLKSMQARQKAAENLQKTYWISAVHGDYEVVLREKLENIAKKLNIKSPGFGTVRTSKITNSVFAVEIDVTFSAPLKDGLEFVTEIENMDTAVYWKRFELSVDQRGGTSSIQWNITLRIPAINTEDAERAN